MDFYNWPSLQDELRSAEDAVRSRGMFNSAVRGTGNIFSEDTAMGMRIPPRGTASEDVVGAMVEQELVNRQHLYALGMRQFNPGVRPIVKPSYELKSPLIQFVNPGSVFQGLEQYPNTTVSKGYSLEQPSDRSYGWNDPYGHNTNAPYGQAPRPLSSATRYMGGAWRTGGVMHLTHGNTVPINDYVTRETAENAYADGLRQFRRLQMLSGKYADAIDHGVYAPGNMQRAPM